MCPVYQGNLAQLGETLLRICRISSTGEALTFLQFLVEVLATFPACFVQIRNRDLSICTKTCSITSFLCTEQGALLTESILVTTDILISLKSVFPRTQVSPKHILTRNNKLHLRPRPPPTSKQTSIYICKYPPRSPQIADMLKLSKANSPSSNRAASCRFGATVLGRSFLCIRVTISLVTQAASKTSPESAIVLSIANRAAAGTARGATGVVGTRRGARRARGWGRTFPISAPSLTGMVLFLLRGGLLKSSVCVRVVREVQLKIREVVWAETGSRMLVGLYRTEIWRYCRRAVIGQVEDSSVQIVAVCKISGCWTIV